MWEGRAWSLSLLIRDLKKWRLGEKGKTIAWSWFHNLDTLGMNARQNWLVQGFSSWTTNGCIFRKLVSLILPQVEFKRSVKFLREISFTALFWTASRRWRVVEGTTLYMCEKHSRFSLTRGTCSKHVFVPAKVMLNCYSQKIDGLTLFLDNVPRDVNWIWEPFWQTGRWVIEKNMT